MNNIRDCGMREKLGNDTEGDGQVLMDFERGYLAELHFNDLAHTILTSERGNVGWKEKGAENASKVEII